jgi:hypothetical protein
VLDFAAFLVVLYLLPWFVTIVVAVLGWAVLAPVWAAVSLCGRVAALLRAVYRRLDRPGRTL